MSDKNKLPTTLPPPLPTDHKATGEHSQQESPHLKGSESSPITINILLDEIVPNNDSVDEALNFLNQALAQSRGGQSPAEAMTSILIEEASLALSGQEVASTGSLTVGGGVSDEVGRAFVEDLRARLNIPLSERLTLEGEVGRGGMGSVEVVIDQALQRRAAMKTLRPEVAQKPMVLRSFIREAQITSQLDHPNIVPVHEMAVDDKGRIYFTMKLVEGRTFSSLVKEVRSSDRDSDYGQVLNILEVFVKVCDALAFAHSRGVLHCDLKPENIMVGDFGQVYLMDWGAARLLSEAAAVPSKPRVRDLLPPLPGNMAKGFLMGTPSLMSPEQALDQELDQRSDIFSLGALLYEVLTDTRPFRANNALQSILLARKCLFVPIEEVPSAKLWPKELIRIVSKAMARHPDDRFQTVEELKNAIMRLFKGNTTFPIKTFPAGSLIIQEGEMGFEAYIVKSGRCEVFRTVHGERVSLRVMERGDIFGELAILVCSPRTASVEALEESTLMVVTGEAIERELDSMKPWMATIIHTLASRFKDQLGRPSGGETP